MIFAECRPPPIPSPTSCFLPLRHPLSVRFSQGVWRHHYPDLNKSSSKVQFFDTAQNWTHKACRYTHMHPHHPGVGMLLVNWGSDVAFWARKARKTLHLHRSTLAECSHMACSLTKQAAHQASQREQLPRSQFSANVTPPPLHLIRLFSVHLGQLAGCNFFFANLQMFFAGCPPRKPSLRCNSGHRR